MNSDNQTILYNYCTIGIAGYMTGETYFSSCQ